MQDTCAPGMGTMLRVGDRVRLIPRLQSESYTRKKHLPTNSSEGSNQADETGIVTHIKEHNAVIDFPQRQGFVVPITDIVLVPGVHPGITCDGCDSRPITGPRFKCKMCTNFDYCQLCFFHGTKSHPHTFIRINEPGVASIFAGKPGKHRDGSTTTGGSEGIAVCIPGVLDDWSKCVRNISVSSLETWAQRLVDGNPLTFWQSCGTQGKHWILLEMHSNVLIQNLKMMVNPDDGSYMPSKLAINVGNSTRSMKQLAYINVGPNATTVVLLAELKEYYRFLEINILQCRNGGIDCRVHGLTIAGRLRTDCDALFSAFWFLASDGEDIDDIDDGEQCVNTSTAPHGRRLSGIETSGSSQLRRDNPVKVFVWGLNDKDQLGGLRGSKVKIPIYSDMISALKPVHIAGGSKSLFIVSHDGKVFACGEGANGRLGLGHSNNVSIPQQLTTLAPYVVKKVAVHSGGKHSMALTVDGKVFSWGEGDDGKLGHGNKVTYDKPKLIEALKSKRIRDIACGSSHSAAITSGGELFTWGLGEYGRLGHGDTITLLKPKMVTYIIIRGGRNLLRFVLITFDTAHVDKSTGRTPCRSSCMWQSRRSNARTNRNWSSLFLGRWRFWKTWSRWERWMQCSPQY